MRYYTLIIAVLACMMWLVYWVVPPSSDTGQTIKVNKEKVVFSSQSAESPAGPVNITFKDDLVTFEWTDHTGAHHERTVSADAVKLCTRLESGLDCHTLSDSLNY